MLHSAQCIFTMVVALLCKLNPINRNPVAVTSWWMNVATWLYTVNSRYTVFTVFTVVTRGQLLQIMQLNCSALPLSTLHTHYCHGENGQWFGYTWTNKALWLRRQQNRIPTLKDIFHFHKNNNSSIFFFILITNRETDEVRKRTIIRKL